MSCYCDYDYDYPEFYIQNIHKARSRHKCDECGTRIFPGEKYENVRAKWDGCVSTWKTCQHCVDLRTWVQNNVPCVCWVHGEIFENAREAVSEAQYRAPEETGGLRFALARRIHKIVALRKARATA
jgi:hypothetical protein